MICFQRGHSLSSSGYLQVQKKKFRASGYLNMNLTTRTNSDMICARKGLAGDWTILVIVMMHYQ
jgi:hypothetical protein